MKVELHTSNQLNFGNLKNFGGGKKFTLSFFNFFQFLFRAYGARTRQEGGGIRQRGCLAAPQPKRVKREKTILPLRGTLPPQVPRSIRTEQDKTIRMNQQKN